MSNIKAESPAVKDENVSEQQQTHEEQEINQQTGPPNFGGGPRRGGPNRFGNRRPGPYNRGGGGQFGDRGDFRRRGGGAGGPHGGHHGGPHGGPNHNDNGPSGRPLNDKFAEKLANLAGPTFDLPPLEQVEKKFNGRTRLYVGNIGADVEENEIRELFSPYGESSEYFINKEKNFAFVRMDYRSNAEKAKRELDGVLFKGKNLKIRFAPNGSTIKVKNLTHFISNELLYTAFQVFGEVERAYILVDERGKPTGEGIVEFARKGCALHAVRKCSEGCFFLNASLRPCIVESYEPSDDTDGYPEKYIPKKNIEYGKSREVGPRFATPGSFEFEYGTRWKQLFELYQQKEAAVKKEFEMEKEKLEAQMEYAKYEHETEMLRDQLRAREMDRDRQKHEWEMKERLAEEQRQRNEEQMRRQQEDMQNRIMHQEEEMRRRQQENNLFMQAHQLDNMLEQQEQAYDQPAPLYGNMNEEDTQIVSDKIEFMKKWEFLYKEKHFLKDYHTQTVQVYTLHYRSNCYYTKTEIKRNEQVQVQHLTENQPQSENLDSFNQADCTIEPANEASCVVGLDNETCEVLRPVATFLPSESERSTSLENGTFEQWTDSDLSPTVVESESDFSTKSLDTFTETSEQRENTTQKISAPLVDKRQATDATSVASEVNETSQESQDGAFAQMKTPSPDISLEYGYYTEESFTETEHHLLSNQQTNLASQRHYSPTEPVYTTSVSNQSNVTSQKWSYEINKPSSEVSCPLSSSESGYGTDQYVAKTEPLSCPIQDVNTNSGVNLTNLSSHLNLSSCVNSVSRQANVTCQQWTYGTTTAPSTVSCPLPSNETGFSIIQQLSAAFEANQTNQTSQASSVYYLNLPSEVMALSNKPNVNTTQQGRYGPHGMSPLVASGDHANPSHARFSPYDRRQPAHENNQARFTHFPNNQSRPFYNNRRQHHFYRGSSRGRCHYNRFSPATRYPGGMNQFPGAFRTPIHQFLSQHQPFYPAQNVNNAINQQNTNVPAPPVSVRGYVPYNINEPIYSNSPIFQEHGANAASVSTPVPVSGYPPSSAINPISSTSYAINQQSTNVLARPGSVRGYVQCNIKEPISSNSPIFQEHGASAVSVSAPVPVSGYPPSSAINPICSTSSVPQQGVAASSASMPVSVFKYEPYTGNVEPVFTTASVKRNRQAQNGTNDPSVIIHSAPVSRPRYNRRDNHCNQGDYRQFRNFSRRGYPRRYNRFAQNSVLVECPMQQQEYSNIQPGTVLENVPQNADYMYNNYNFPNSNRNYGNSPWTPQGGFSNQPASPNESSNLAWTSKASSHSSAQSNTSQNLTLTSQACFSPISSSTSNFSTQSDTSTNLTLSCNSPVSRLTSSSTSSLTQNSSTIQKYENPKFVYMIDGKHPYVLDHEEYNYWFEKLKNENDALARLFYSNFKMF